MAKSEKEKMLCGELYSALDEELSIERKQARKLLSRFNQTDAEEESLRNEILQQLFGSIKDQIHVEPPFYCDYGSNIHVGRNVVINFNCVFLDVTKISIGSGTLIGPGVHLYTACHPKEWKTRARGLEYGKPITIGDNVWIGGGAIILPGVSIGDHSIIGAGSIVTHDVPADVMAAGNPCRIIRQLE